MRIKTFIVLAAALLCFPAQAFAQGNKTVSNPSKSASGFLASPQLESSPSKWAIISKDGGSFQWKGNSGESETGLHLFTPVGPIRVAQAVDGPFESYNYPYIKWKPIILPTGAKVQLETTIQAITPGLDSPAPVGGSALLRYKVRVSLHGTEFVPPLQIRLLDRDGFSLANFSVWNNSFYLADPTDLEAQGTSLIPLDSYKAADEYSVRLI